MLGHVSNVASRLDSNAQYENVCNYAGEKKKSSSQPTASKSIDPDSAVGPGLLLRLAVKPGTDSY
jgi:hypothetical protein